ncbi:MAG: hypothetical protein KKA84_00075 [Bacteroidetes bacterium]|nr:hypothetical protein [Bacteroidota bacterium]
MRLIQSVIYFLIICVVISGQSEKGKLVIKTDVETSAIILNDELIGHGEIEIPLESGTYNVMIKKNPCEWGSEIIFDEVFIDNNAVERKYSFESEVFLDSDPTDAYVYYEDELIGHTPLFINSNVGSVDLLKPSFKSSMNINLKQMGKVPQRINLEFQGVESEPALRETIWFKVLLGSAVLVGGTAAYYKIQADNEYQKYLETEDTSFRDRTDKYDAISGVSFGLLQLNFAAILYFLLAD